MGGNLVRSVLAAMTMSCGVVVTSITSLNAQSVAIGLQPELGKGTKAAVVSVDVKNADLKRVLRLISRQAGLELYFPDASVMQSKPVTMRVRDMAVEDAFAKALTGTGLTATIASNMVLFSPVHGTAPMVQGGVTGTVLDAQTRHPIRRATVMLDDTPTGVVTGDDGRFRLINVTPGQHTLRVKTLGYSKATKPVTVVDGQITTVEIALTASVSALDQVIVTGTIIETAQREVPNAITVITAKELEQRGITQINQLFHGDVPGLFALNQGSSVSLDEVVMYSRGATVLSDQNPITNAITNNTNPIKTYVDGIAMADSKYLSQIDPKTIERIEIITGPQASTVYGSNAINGVMQIFTKRGVRGKRPQLTVSLQSGLIQNNFRPTLTPKHNHSVQLQGVEGEWSYSTTTSWDYEGPWTPAKRTSRLGGNVGVRLQHGPITADGSIRLAQTYNQLRGIFNQLDASLRASGFWVPTSTNGLNTTGPEDHRLNGQTLGFTLGYTPTSWWSHQLGLGIDQSARESKAVERGYRMPSDSLLRLSTNQQSRTSWRYTSNAKFSLRDVAHLTVTAGGDGWTSATSTLTVSTVQLTGQLGGSPIVSRRTSRNAGGFVQSQLGLWDRIYLTQGLRAEWNPNYGEEAQPNLDPRYGVSYVQDVGAVTMKLRASYGQSTRPPDEEMKYTQYALERLPAYVPFYGNYEVRRANPLLGPEYQKGAEGGIEVFLGKRASLIVTRYNQTVDGLIQGIQVDSVRSFDKNPNQRIWLDADGYGWARTIQFFNMATIRNQGWEGQGRLTLGPLSTQGTFSYNKSRIIGIPALDFALLPQAPASLGLRYLPGGSFKTAPEHTWALGFTYAQSRATLGLHLNGTGQVLGLATREEIEISQSATRIRKDLPTMQNLLGSRGYEDGYMMANLNGSYRFSPRVEGILQMNNVADYYRADDRPTSAVMGRQTTLGLRLRF